MYVVFTDTTYPHLMAIMTCLQALRLIIEVAAVTVHLAGAPAVLHGAPAVEAARGTPLASPSPALPITILGTGIAPLPAAKMGDWWRTGGKG